MKHESMEKPEGENASVKKGLEQEFRSNFTRGERIQREKADTRLDQVNESIQNKGNPSKEQGEIGEGIAIRVATEKLGLTPDPRFDTSAHGFDCVSQDPQGRICVVEAKFDNRGIRALRGDQMQPEWIERNARMMQNPGNERFTKGNSELGREIITSDPENVRRIVITNDPKTLEIKAYEGKENGSWELIGGPWPAIDFEQPIPEW